ncbi:P-loop containing nucleoside triphosphate hydrolase protein [Syncephalis fuscata]|nr:P-loop containing nucleoside triphosphate hydrolase protein [Syncephalis fuscata]
MPASFVMTIDDTFTPEIELDDSISDSELQAPKQSNSVSKANSNQKKRKAKKNSANDDEDESAGALNPNFVFDDAGEMTQSRNIWDFKAARAALKAQNKIQYTTIDEIIEKKRKSNAKLDKEDVEESDDDESVNPKLLETNEASNKEMEDNEAKGSDSNDDDEDEETGDDDDDDDDLNHLKDRVRGHGELANEIDSDEEIVDANEEKRKREYFAPEEDTPDTVAETFATMNLSRPVLKALTQVGFAKPTLIQARAIPVALLGKDICGGAVTGSGKTAAFIVPILERLVYRPRTHAATRVLILCPTRELAIQCHSVATKLAAFTDVQFCLCVGGLSLKVQEAELRQKPDVVIATPGRLIDHVRNSQSFNLDSVEILVMDEADRMLDDGFKEELTEIINSCPRSRQTMLFSATMTDNVDELVRLSLNRPVRLLVDNTKATVETLIQEFIRVRKHREDDRAAILASLCLRHFQRRCIIFFRSKVSAHQMKIVFGLLGLKAAELHGNLSQEQRLAALERFRDGEVDFLLATDLAARGIDIKGIESVINYNMPVSYAQYLHRIGRTARAGQSGRSVTLAGEDDRKVLKEAIKNAPAETVKHRVIPAEVIEQFKRRVDGLKTQVDEILEEEKEDRLLKQAEMDMTRAQNLLEHQDEIYSRPARTWFQTEMEKKRSKEKLATKHAEKVKASKGDRDNDDKVSAAKLTRKKRRRLETAEEDARAAKSHHGSIKASKRSGQRKRMTQMHGGGDRLADVSNRAAGPKSEKARARLAKNSKKSK